MHHNTLSPDKLPEPYRSRLSPDFTRQDLEKIIQEELENDEAVKNYLNPYSDWSGKTFISGFARMKADALINMATLQEQYDFQDTIFQEYAESHLWIIQQKKLFDLQCQWRAGLIELPDVETTYDFYYWENDIARCPFIPPITAEEVAWYQEYLSQLTFVDVETFLEPENGQWQDYDELKEAYEFESAEGAYFEYPPWYVLYDLKAGQNFMVLPDVRGDQQRRYLSAYHRAQAPARQYTPEEREALNAQVNKAHIDFYDEDQISDFIKSIEPVPVQRILNKYRHLQNSVGDQESHMALFDIFSFLRDIREAVPVEAASDWRVALINAKRDYVRRKTIDALIPAFEDYKMKLEMGILMKATVDDISLDLANTMRQQVREGKRLLEQEGGDA